jgi:hypothetical protein
MLKNCLAHALSSTSRESRFPSDLRFSESLLARFRIIPSLPSFDTSPFESPRGAGTPGAASAGMPYPWGPSGLGGYIRAHFFLFKRPGAGSAAALRAAPRRWPGPAFAGGFGGQAREGVPVRGEASRLAWCHSLGTSGVTAAGGRGRKPREPGEAPLLLCHPPPPRIQRDRSAFARSLRRTGTRVSHTGKAGENSPEPLRERAPPPRLRRTGQVGRPGVELHGL